MRLSSKIFVSRHPVSDDFIDRNDEIVLPEEQTGSVRDKWLWNVLIRRGATKEGIWLSAPSQ